MKYNKTKYPNIYYYETAKGKRYYVRRSFFFRGKKREKSKRLNTFTYTYTFIYLSY